MIARDPFIRVPVNLKLIKGAFSLSRGLPTIFSGLKLPWKLNQNSPKRYITLVKSIIKNDYGRKRILGTGSDEISRFFTGSRFIFAKISAFLNLGFFSIFSTLKFRVFFPFFIQILQRSYLDCDNHVKSRGIACLHIKQLILYCRITRPVLIKVETRG